jgi:hypothetical protein
MQECLLFSAPMRTAGAIKGAVGLNALLRQLSRLIVRNRDGQTRSIQL